MRKRIRLRLLLVIKIHRVISSSFYRNNQQSTLLNSTLRPHSCCHSHTTSFFSHRWLIIKHLTLAIQNLCLIGIFVLGFGFLFILIVVSIGSSRKFPPKLYFIYICFDFHQKSCWTSLDVAGLTIALFVI